MPQVTQLQAEDGKPSVHGFFVIVYMTLLGYLCQLDFFSLLYYNTVEKAAVITVSTLKANSNIVSGSLFSLRNELIPFGQHYWCCQKSHQ